MEYYFIAITTLVASTQQRELLVLSIRFNGSLVHIFTHKPFNYHHVLYFFI